MSPAGPGCISMEGRKSLFAEMHADDGIFIFFADVTSLVNVILGKTPQETINLSVDSYKVDNATVVGTWYAPDGSSFTFQDFTQLRNSLDKNRCRNGRRWQ